MLTNDISIVIVTYNSSNYIGELLLSIGKAHAIISDIVIIENNSPDNEKTKKEVMKWIKQSNIKTRFINKKMNLGFGKACNLGAKESNGKYLLFLNPDTKLLPYSLEILLKHTIKLGASISGGKMLKLDDPTKVHGSIVRIPNLDVLLFEFSNLGKLFAISSGHKYFYYEDTDSNIFDKDVEVEAVSGGYMLILRKAFEELEGFDTDFFMYLEDVDLCERALSHKMKIIYCPHSEILHIGGASSKNKYKIRHQAWFESRKLYVKKHFGFISNLFIQPLYSIEEIILKKIRNL